MVKGVSFRVQHCLIHLPCCLTKDPMKRDFLHIYLTTFLGIRNFRNTSAMGVIFFLKVWKILSTFQKCREIFWKIFFLDNLMWTGCVNLSLLKKKTCDRQSICSETVRRFCILLRETLCNLTAFTLINKFAEAVVFEISTVSWPLFHSAFRRIFRNGTFETFI